MSDVDCRDTDSQKQEWDAHGQGQTFDASAAMRKYSSDAGPGQKEINRRSTLNDHRQDAAVAQIDDFTGVSSRGDVDGNQCRQAEIGIVFDVRARFLEPEADHGAGIAETHRFQMVE